MQEFFNSIVEQFNANHINLERLILLQLILGGCLIFYYILGKRLIRYYFNKGEITAEGRKKIKNIVRFCFFLIGLLLTVIILGLNIALPEAGSPISISNIIIALLIIQVARLFDFFFGRIVNRFYKNVEKGEKVSLGEYTRVQPEKTAGKTLQYAIYTFAAILILQKFQIDLELFNFQVGEDTYHFRISSIFSAILILLIARLLVWLITQIFLNSYYQSREVDLGSQYAINQLISYFIYIIAFVMALDNMGVQMTVLWGGIAALLVGVGLGLQQTFNDLFSGILLLFERTVEVGDVIEINGDIGNVKRIGLRTSLIESRDNVTMIIPNSKLVMDGIVNWTHFDSKVRFKIPIGVAYGADTSLVKQLLLEAVDHPKILKRPTPFVRFTEFGASSLDFELLFYSRNFSGINDVKSDIRFKIDQLFRDNNIEIPFPQRDIWIRSKGGGDG